MVSVSVLSSAFPLSFPIWFYHFIPNHSRSPLPEPRMLLNFLMFLPFFQGKFWGRENEMVLKILWPRYQVRKLVMMSSSKTAPQPKYMLLYPHLVFQLFPQRGDSFSKNNSAFQKLEFLCFHMGASKFPYSSLHAHAFSFIFFLLELVRNFVLHDMTVEIQKALITEQDPSCLKEDQRQPCSNCTMSSNEVRIISAQTDSRSWQQILDASRCAGSGRDIFSRK